jgi:apolipoprotein N-acyltransferase
MQLASVFGIAGISFLIYWINISITQIMLNKKISFHSFYLPFSLLLTVIIFGSLRIDIGKSKGQKTLTVAAVGTTSEVSGLPLPSKESNDKVISDLLQKTRQAGTSGAKLVVWNEAAFYTLPENETIVLDSIIAKAKEYGVSIIASYVMPISENPFKYENKFKFISSNGEVEYSYLKHQPVPGEPAVKGTETFKTVQIAGSNLGAAICYDYDFPYIAGAYGALKADIVAVPSSDWRGIDPLHTRMAAFRAIEQGHSIIRSTRFGLSAAISPYGEIISQSSSFDENSRIMIADIPSHGFATMYLHIGNAFIYLCIGFIFVFLFQIIKKSRAE